MMQGRRSSRWQFLAGGVFFLVLIVASALPGQQDPEAELREGTSLTKRGLLQQAIPHLEAARGHVREEYAASFNLALCYLGVGEYRRSIDVLHDLKSGGFDTAEVEGLLAQAYAGDGRLSEALAAFTQAASQAPANEKLYTFMADACTDHHQLELGLRVAGIGLKNLPDSARLHYERAMFLAQLDRFPEAKPEFERAYKFAPTTNVGYLARVQEHLFADEIPEALRAAREGLRGDPSDAVLMALYGEVLLHSGVTPDQPEFAEARTALEKAVAARPNYSTAQISLGKLYLMDGRSKDAIEHLEIGLRMEPHNAAVYSNLATAYRPAGEMEKAQSMLRELRRLLEQQAAARSAAGAQTQ